MISCEVMFCQNFFCNFEEVDLVFILVDQFTVKGKVAADRDIGAGYVYPVLVEDAVIK